MRDLFGGGANLRVLRIRETTREKNIEFFFPCQRRNNIILVRGTSRIFTEIPAIVTV